MASSSSAAGGNDGAGLVPSPTSSPLGGVHAFAAIGENDDFVQNWDYAPRVLQPEDVEIRILAAGVCHSDLHQVRREWKGRQPRPLVPGHEIVGIVERAGAKSKHAVGARVSVGTLVGCCFACAECQQGEENHCRKGVDTYTGTHVATGTRCHGGFANRVVVDSRFAFAVPRALPSTTAAPLMCAGATVYSPLRRYCTPAQTVGIVGIGGLGHLALQFARAMDIKNVVAITSSADKGEAAKKFGATDIVVSSDAESMNKARGTLDFMLVTVSADIPWNAYLRLLKVGGHLCVVGLPPTSMKLEPAALAGRRLMVSGSNTAGLGMIRDMLQLAADRNVRVAVELLPLTAKGANEALQRVAKNTPRFRCVLISEELKQAEGSLL